MKNMTKNLFIGLTLSSIALFTSCNDEVYDFNGNSGVAFIQSSTSTSVKSIANSFECTILNTPAGAFGTFSMKFPVNCSSPVEGDATVELAIDNSLIAKYNSDKKTSYTEIPAEMLEIRNKQLTIVGGQYQTKDSIEIALKPNLVSSLEAKEYLVPIKLLSISNGMKISNSRNVAYLVVKITEDKDNLWNIATTNKGNLLVGDKADWKVSAVNSTLGSAVANLLDDNIETYTNYRVSRYDENTALIVDMAKEYTNIKGFRIDARGDYYAIKDFDVLTSNDGTTWTSQGNMKNSNASAEAIFYTPVTARYVKFLVRRMASSYTNYLSGINMYI